MYSEKRSFNKMLAQKAEMEQDLWEHTTMSGEQKELIDDLVERNKQQYI